MATQLELPFAPPDPRIGTNTLQETSMVEKQIHKITVIVPTLNEADSITQVLSSLRLHVQSGLIDEIIVADSSDDGTDEKAKLLGVTVLRVRKKGKGAAVSSAVGRTRNSSIIIMDGDGSHRPDEIGRINDLFMQGYLVLKGTRFAYGGYTYDMPLLRKMGNLFLVKLLRLLGFKITDLCYGYIAFKKHIYEIIPPTSDNLAFDVNFVVRCLVHIKEMVAEFPSVELRRNGGKKKSSTIGTGFEVLAAIFEGLVTNRRHGLC